MVSTDLPLEVQLTKVLGSAIGKEDILAECAHICRMYQLSADDFYTKWEVFAVNQGLDQDEPLKYDYVEQLKQIIQTEFMKKASAGKLSKRSGTHVEESMSKLPKRTIHTSETLLSKNASQVPFSQQPPFSNSQDSSQSSANFSDRPHKGKLESVFNPDLAPVLISNGIQNVDEAIPATITSAKPKLVDNQILKPFKYMYDKVSDFGEYMDDYLLVFDERFRSSYPEIEEFTNPSYPTQSTVYALGRIVVDEGKKLNLSSIVLECDRRFNGVQVKLHLEPSLPFHSLIPGQIVVVEGSNPEGILFHVTKIYHLPLLSSATTSARELLSLPYIDSQIPQVALVGAGPFTTTTDLAFEPIKELVRLIESRKPNLVILLGPFIDHKHPDLISGLVSEPVTSMVQRQISLVSAAIKRCQGELIVLPSVMDVSHPYICYPQPPMKPMDEVFMLPNPVQIKWNDLILGITSRDVLMDVASNECCTIARPGPNDVSDRVARAARHILEQRTFYPVFPPPENTGSVDYHRATQLELQVSPDLLIIPSQLRPGTKSIPLDPDPSQNAATLLVNPGFASRGAAGGTYAVLTVHPFPKAQLQQVAQDAQGTDGDYLFHSAHQRVRVDIIRL